MTVGDERRAREWHLVRRPRAQASIEDFALVETTVPDLAPGQVLVRNTHLSVDPYMRGRMDDRPSYLPPFPLHAPLEGAAVGVVVESRAEGVKAPDGVAVVFDNVGGPQLEAAIGRLWIGALLGLLRGTTPIGKAVVRLREMS
jgi:NADPH-dependent curcumin reductase CurA